MARAAEILALQAPQGVPVSDLVETVTDPINACLRTNDLLAHFWSGLYDRTPESHLTRLCKVILGDAGIGGIRKRYVYSHLSQVLLTTHFSDLDALYGAIFGLKRLSGEVLDFDPYFEAADADEWEVIFARDAAYRARIEQFSHALAWGGTPTGMILAAQAILGTEVRLYETYMLIDEGAVDNPGGAPPPVGGRTYGEVQTAFGTPTTYGDLEERTYADIEAGSGVWGRTTGTNRSEFILRPMRQITAEENYTLIRVLSRLKPASALLTIDPNGVALHSEVPSLRVAAESEHWQVRAKVAPSEKTRRAYKRSDSQGTPIEQPKPAFAAYQGEAWSYNTDINKVVSFTMNDEGEVLSVTDFQRLAGRTGNPVEYTPDKALADKARINMGRYVSDGVLAVAPARSGAR